MHSVVPNLTEQDCVVLDSTAVSCSGLDGTGLGWAVRIALLCTALYWTRLDFCWPIWTWAMLDINVLSWKGMYGIGWERTELNGTGVDWTDTDFTRWTGQEYTSAEWTGLDWVGQHFRGLNWMALHFTGQECLSLSLNSPDFTRLHHSTLDWTGKYHTGQSAHCTSLDWSAPNCIARFQMKLI